MTKEEKIWNDGYNSGLQENKQIQDYLSKRLDEFDNPVIKQVIERKKMKYGDKVKYYRQSDTPKNGEFVCGMMNKDGCVLALLKPQNKQYESTFIELVYKES